MLLLSLLCEASCFIVASNMLHKIRNLCFKSYLAIDLLCAAELLEQSFCAQVNRVIYFKSFSLIELKRKNYLRVSCICFACKIDERKNLNDPLDTDRASRLYETAYES